MAETCTRLLAMRGPYQGEELAVHEQYPVLAGGGHVEGVELLGVLYTNNKQTYAHRRCRKMSSMQYCAYLSTAPRCSGLETGARMRDMRLGEPTESILCRIIDRNVREHIFYAIG